MRASSVHEVIQIITGISVSHLRHHLTPVWTIKGKLESGCLVKGAIPCRWDRPL